MRVATVAASLTVLLEVFSVFEVSDFWNFSANERDYRARGGGLLHGIVVLETLSCRRGKILSRAVCGLVALLEQIRAGFECVGASRRR